MFIKNISFVYFLCFANCIDCSPFATKLLLDKNISVHSAGNTRLPADLSDEALAKSEASAKAGSKDERKVSKKSPLCMLVERYEENFIKAYEQCLQTDDYYTDKEYEQARHCTVYAIIKVIQHINNLEHGDHNKHTTCEKCEAKIIKKRLIALLENKNNN